MKGFVILAAAEGVLLLWKGASAAARHATRVVAIISVLLLPLATQWAPGAGKPVWAVRSERLPGNEIALSIQLAPRESARAVLRPSDADNTAEPTRASYGRGIQFSDAWAALGLTVWLGGVVVALLPIVAGSYQRRLLTQNATGAPGSDWDGIFAEAKSCVRLGRRVRLLVSSQSIIPITWGSLWPTILMPECAARWSDERKQVTLAHELAHVKRWDYFTQALAQFACALYWFNPLIWHCARGMRLDREQACDDWVVASGCKPSDYAGHLVEIASMLRPGSLFSGIAMARPSQLEERVVALVAASRSRGAPSKFVRMVMAGAALSLVIAVGAQKIERSAGKDNRLREEHIEQLKRFAAQKEKHAEAIAEEANQEIVPEFRKFFDAAKKGEWQAVANMYADFRGRHSQYVGEAGDLPHTAYWSTVLETCLAYADVTWGEPEHVEMGVKGFMNSIPPGAIYFGGTDPGRGLPTAFSKNHAEADPFFTLTQNALADGSYLDYLRKTYGGKIYTPSAEDSAATFNDYIQDATARYHAGKLKPGEDVTIEANRTQVRGQIAVMEINARLAKIIFERNRDREFYIEESFPLDWMNPYLSPAGQVMKINREPLATIPDELIQKDIAYWNERAQKFVGTSIESGKSMKEFIDFIDLVYVRHGGSSKADRKFLENDWAQRAFSKWRSGGARIYSWRAGSATDAVERQRMQNAAELALRQAFALCPTSPEAVYRYASFLVENKRTSDATAMVETSMKVSPDQGEIRNLLSQLNTKTK